TSVDTPPLHAVSTSTSANGIYAYSASSAFPTSVYNSTNYWVDVVFSPSVSPAPAATSTPVPTSTFTRVPTATSTATSVPTATSTPQATATSTPVTTSSGCPCSIWNNTVAPS